MNQRDLQDNLHIRLFETRLLTIDERWNTPDVCSSFWRFYHNDKSGASLLQKTGDFALEGGQCYFVPAQVAFACCNIETLEHFYIHFDVVGASSLAMRELFDAPLAIPGGKELQTRSDMLAQAVRRAEPESIELHCRLKALLYESLACCIQSAPPERLARCWQFARQREPVLPALQYIEAHLSEVLSNPLLANLCAMSPNFFIRRFRECVGQTPVQYIQERRVGQAAQQLLFTSRSIEQVAEETGFGNRFYFSRVFARHTGVSPASYRKAARV